MSFAGDGPQKEAHGPGRGQVTAALREALGLGSRARGGDGEDGDDDGGDRGAGATATLPATKEGTTLRRGFSENFLVYSANVGGLHLTGRSEGAARGIGVTGAFSRSFQADSKWHRLEQVLRQYNVDEVQTRRHALVVLSETQTRRGELEVTRTTLQEWGYSVVISRGVPGAQREERGGVLVAWDAKTLSTLPIGGVGGRIGLLSGAGSYRCAFESSRVTVIGGRGVRGSIGLMSSRTGAAGWGMTWTYSRVICRNVEVIRRC